MLVRIQYSLCHTRNSTLHVTDSSTLRPLPSTSLPQSLFNSKAVKICIPTCSKNLYVWPWNFCIALMPSHISSTDDLPIASTTASLLQVIEKKHLLTLCRKCKRIGSKRKDNKKICDCETIFVAYYCCIQ